MRAKIKGLGTYSVRVKPVYIETSILGYLTARSTRNSISAANIEVTKEWWESRRSAFTLYISQVVLGEVAQGAKAIMQEV